jgi:hypothetical protein
MIAEPTPEDFNLIIDYEKNSPNPERVFSTMAALITTFKSFDNTLIKSIDSSIEPVLLLEDIEIGSLKARLRQALRAANDEALLNLDWKPLIGQYLVKAKYLLIHFIDGKASISDAKEIRQLQDDLLNLAEETGAKQFPYYAPLKPAEIIEHIEKLDRAVKLLDKNDKAYFKSNYGEANFNLSFDYSPEKIEELLTKESIENNTEMILKVKKPDYLSSSQWEFKHDTKSIPAKILDSEWVTRFQKREEDVRPGDSIRATVKVTVKYGFDFSIIRTQYDIIKVHEVISLDRGTQLTFEPED